MKKLVTILIVALMLAGCSNAPVAMKTNKKYFVPVKSLASKPVVKSKNRVVSASIAKELSEKSTMIELLKRENRQLRDRLKKLEKQLAIMQS